jgi:hypothetical protein
LNRSDLVDQLQLVEQDIERGARLVARQRLVIEQRTRNRLETDGARELLRKYEDLLRSRVSYRDRVREELRELSVDSRWIGPKCEPISVRPTRCLLWVGFSRRIRRCPARSSRSSISSIAVVRTVD